MIRTVISAFVSHWRRQPFQFATLVLGLALATGLWSAVQAINAEARASYQQAADQLAMSQRDVLTDPGGFVSMATYVALRRAGWQVSPVLEGRLRTKAGSVPLIGVDLLSYPAPPVPLTGNQDLSALDLLTGEGRLFAQADMAASLQGQGLPEIVTSDRVPAGLVLTDIRVAARLLNQPDQISRLLVLAPPTDDLPLLPEIAPDLVLTRMDGASDTARLTDSFHLNLTAFGLLSFAVGLFIVHGTAGLAFEQRRGVFRTLRALGVPLGVLSRLVLAELLVLALIAGALGLVIGYLVAAALLPDVAATLRGLYGAPVGGGLTLRPAWFVSGLGMAVLGALTAGAQALWRMRQVTGLANTGGQDWITTGRRQSRIMACIGASLGIAGTLSLFFADGLIAGFAFLAGIMLGAALILPQILHLILTLAERHSTSVLGQWIWADMRAQLPGLSLALMALLLALATNIGVGTMVSSFRLTFTGWLDQRLASELYVTARSDDQGAEIAKWLAIRSDAVLPIRSAESQINGLPTRIFGVADHATFRDNWPLLQAAPQVWDRLAEGNTALINEQMARRDDLWTGDRITLAPGWSTEIVGVYSDYGNPSGQVIVALPALLEHFQDTPNRQFGVRVNPDNALQLADQLRLAFDLPAGAVRNQNAIKAASVRIFEKTFVVTGALNILTLGVASFAILTSLLTLWTMRLPQIAPIWAMGLTRRKLAQLDLLRSLCLSALTMVLALPLGLVLAWALLAVINVEAFGWRLPMYLFPLDWLRLGALALLAGGVAAILPARKLVKMPPSELLKVFVNDR